MFFCLNKMGRNPKHSKKHQKRAKRRTFKGKKVGKELKSKTLFDLRGFAKSPKLPSVNRMNIIEKNHREVLFEIEATIMEHFKKGQGLFHKQTLDDLSVSRVIARLLWQKIHWKYKNKRCSQNIIQKLNLSKKENKLAKDIYGIIKKYYKKYIEEIKRKKKKSNNIGKRLKTLGQKALLERDTDLRKTNLSYTKKHLWEILACIYDSCIFWDQKEGYHTAYLDFIEPRVPTMSELEETILEMDEEIEMEKQLEKQLEKLNREIEGDPEQENKIYLKRVTDRRNQVKKLRYSTNELKGYQHISDGIYQFWEIHTMEHDKNQIQKGLGNVESSLKKALKYHTRNLELNHSLMAIHLYKKEYTAITKLYKNMDRSLKNDFYSLMFLGLAYSQMGEYQKAINAYKKQEKMAEYKEQRASVLAKLGYVYEGIQDFERAIKSFKKAFALDNTLDFIQSEIEKINAVRQLNEEKNEKGEEPIKIQMTNSYDFMDLVATNIYMMDEVHFIGNTTLQDQLLGKR